MRTFHRLVVLAAMAAATASSARAQDAAGSAPIGSYSGSIRAASFQGVSDNTRYSGSVDVIPSEKKAGNWKVSIKFSASGRSSMAMSSNMMQWSVSPGRCGSRVQFLVQPTETPPIEMRTGGDAELLWEGALPLAANGSYQLMVYPQGGVREQNMAACANLRYAAPKK